MKTSILDRSIINNYGDIPPDDIELVSHEVASSLIALATSAPHSGFYNALFEHLKAHVQTVLLNHAAKNPNS